MAETKKIGANGSPPCERCGQPAANVNRNGEHTGAHRDLEECLRELGRRVATLERELEPSPRIRQFADGTRVVVERDHAVAGVDRIGTIRWGRWEAGNRSWAYSVQLDAGGRTRALEAWLKPCT